MQTFLCQVRQNGEAARLQAEIEDQVITMIALRAPLAEDLRHIMAALKITGDLERIGDLAKNIAKRSGAIASEQTPKPLIVGLRNMVERALSQLKDVLDAYLDNDTNKAIKVWRSDAEVDELYNSLLRELLTYMMEDPRTISEVLDVVWVARSLERIGDHAKNISEYVIYLVKGKDIRHIDIEKVEKDILS